MIIDQPGLNANGDFISLEGIFSAAGVIQAPAPPAAVLWEPIFTSTFTGADTDPWPPEWATYGDPGAIEDLLSNQGRLFSPSTVSAYASAILAEPLRNIRTDYELTIPNDGVNGRFNSYADLRIVHTTSVPSPHPDAYRLRIRRFLTGEIPNARLTKVVAGTNTDLGGTVDLTNAELVYRARFQILGNKLSMAVRPFSAGAIPEGSWDVEFVDNSITQAGTLRLRMQLVGASVNNQSLTDNVVISRFVGGFGPLIAGQRGRRVIS